jgi:hypothetical protein
MPDTSPSAAAIKRREINLDAARAERAAKRGEPPVIILEGTTYPLPPELPTDFVELIVEERLKEAFAILVGAEALAELEAKTKLSVEDWETIAEGVTEAYGIQGGLGNLRPSGS